MYLLTAQEMRRLDELSIRRDGIPSLVLMENAGRETFRVIKKILRNLRGKRIAVFCGPGNNGGDGLVLLRLLLKAGAKATAVCLFSEESLEGDPLEQFRKLRKGRGKVTFVVDSTSLRKEMTAMGEIHLVVDALFGTGLTRPLEGIFKEAVEGLNAVKAIRVAIDIPSGLSADTGGILGAAFKADHTVALGFPKKGFFLGEGGEYCGTLHVVPIGLSEKAVSESKPDTYLITRDDLGTLFRPRRKQTHKGTYGHVFTIGGSTGKTGAAVMTAWGALSAGAGLSTLALPERAYSRLDPNALEIMTKPIPDDGRGFFSSHNSREVLSLVDKASVVALGPGIGTGEETVRFVHEIVRHCRAPLVIDADGLNAVSSDPAILKLREGFTLLTPHPTEMARLLHTTTDTVQKDRIDAARSFARDHRVHVVLKGYRSIVAFPDGEIWINPTGGPAMATAGSGDVLTGIYAGLLSEFGPVKQAVLGGVFLHGLVGDLLADKGKRVVMATDLIKNLHLAFKA